MRLATFNNPVEMGGILQENGLEELETIAHISARLLANSASLKMKREQVVGRGRCA
ncbi:MAG: hypothetical protein ACYYK0_02180 [Candidatus Eutrophobiaceae bacterium]